MSQEYPSHVPKSLLEPYDPVIAEPKIQNMWDESGYANPDRCIADGHTDADANTFSIVLPPPNVTGKLHVGHSLMLAVQDVAVRYNRMCGKRTLWIPGTDHAAIATESKVAKLLQKEKIRKSDLGREAFLERVEAFAQNSQDEIISQLKKTGASLDFSRLAYTMDDTRKTAVFTAFKKLYDLGLIYRGHRIVNWDPKGQTVISDDEIVRKEETSKFYYFQYGPFVIGTARPETKFGDKYVVMHPDDARYAQYTHGQKITVEWINGPIETTVIKDDIVDPEFGTGVMTITPWHSQIDFEIAERHGLDKEQIIDKYGKLMDSAGEEFVGMKIKDAREKIVEKLESKGLVVNIEDGYTHQLATAERTGGIIEPQIMHQWFIDVEKEFILEHSEIDGIESGASVTLKKLMQHAVRAELIDVLPKRFEKMYFHWIDNLHNWCISRQIWFGHRIPVWYKVNCEAKEGDLGYKGDEIQVSQTSPGDGWVQDEDSLDTWFSSGLWTFSTLGWPEQTPDVKTYHPTTLIETGYDILFPWVARMILMSTTLMGQIPFKTVYLHGLVRDAKGQKISKSLGNNVDPVDMITLYGADALRMAQIVAVGPGNDNNLGENKIKAYKKFANKLWNIARFVVTHVDTEITHDIHKDHQLYLDQVDELHKKITDHMDKYQYYLASEELYHYIWHTFADEIIESLKELVTEKGHPNGDSARSVLAQILVRCLVMLHPFMPHVTEEIWQLLPTHIKQGHKPMLIIEPWQTRS